jgi:hypothetical protein
MVVPDANPSRHVAFLNSLVDSQHGCAMAYAAAKLSQLQNGTSAPSGLVPLRRWLIERFFAWIPWQRRILVRWEYHTQNFLALFNSPASLSSSGDFEIRSRDFIQ